MKKKIRSKDEERWLSLCSDLEIHEEERKEYVQAKPSSDNDSDNDKPST